MNSSYLMGAAATEELHIASGHIEQRYWRDVWRYRELFMFLAWRDILVRYKQTVIGLSWSIIRPLMTMVVFSIVFGRLAGLSSGSVPYILLVGAATLPWQFFSNALGECSASVIGNAGMVSKVYFPRVIIPVSAVIVSIADFLIGCSILFFVMAFYKVVPSWRLLWLPAFFGIAALAALGAGLWMAALTVRYRDFRHVVPFLLQIGFYVSPIGYSSSLVPQKWRLLYSLNPMVGVIDGFRWAILGGNTELYWPGFCLSVALVVAILAIGVRVFRRLESEFADVI